MKLNTGLKKRPRRTLLYGVHGVGKSKWAASAPNAAFLNLEDGLDDIDCTSTDLFTTYTEAKAALTAFVLEEHSYDYLVVDTVDWLEKLIHKEVASEAKKESISDIGYGNGYKKAMFYWDKLLYGFDTLRRQKNMGIILLAHCDIKKFDSPEADSYDRYQPALHTTAAALLQEWCDEVLFASYRVNVRKEDQGYDKTRAIAMGDGERYIRTRETPAMLAKNRLDMPSEIPMPKEGGFAEYSKFFPGNIEGIVVDGSSKKVKAKV